MIGASMTSGDRRALIFGTAMIASLAGASRGIPTAARWQSAFVDSARVRVGAQQRGVAALRSLPVLQSALAAQRQDIARLGDVVPVGDAATAMAAVLGSVIDTLAADAALRVTSLELSADTTRHADVVPLSVHLIGSCDVAGLMSFMRAVDNARLTMAVRELNVTPANSASSDGEPEVLHVDLVIASVGRQTSAVER